MGTSLHERQRLDSMAAVMEVMDDDWKTIEEVVAATGLSKRTVWTCLQELDDEFRIEPQEIKINGRWRTRYRAALKMKMKPLYQSSRFDSRTLARCLGGYTHKGM